MLGDVIGFVAAAHLYSEKIKQPVEVYFQESRKDILKYFDGVVWVPKEPGMVDCGGDPTEAEWFQEHIPMNGVSRFYRFMDPSLERRKTFDVHFNRKRKEPTEKIIGLITHSNTQGDIDDSTLETMLSDARKAYPEHKICLIGNKDNKNFPEGVEDWRQEKGDINWIISTIEKCSLLITPQSGPCFIAAGFRIPMWVYRSKERFWDQVLNYEDFWAIKWYDRPKKNKNNYEVFERLYQKGGWNGLGSGPGSLVENNREYIWLLHKIIDYTPAIKTIVDIGCGDWQIMKELNLKKNYVGIDVSPTVISKNEKYVKENINFVVGNIVTDDLPDGDLCIIKDVLQHLPNKDVFNCLEKIKKLKYCLITNDYTDSNTGDINIGEWRPINILLPPFSVDGISLYGYNGKHVVLLRNK